MKTEYLKDLECSSPTARICEKFGLKWSRDGDPGRFL